MQERPKMAKWYAAFLAVFILWQGLVIIGVKSMRNTSKTVASAQKSPTKPAAPTVIYMAGAQAIGK